MGIWHRLQRRADSTGDASVAIVGAGYVGTGVVHAIAQSPGMRPSLIVNRNTDRGVAALTQMGVAADDIVVTDSVDSLTSAIRAGQPAVTSHASVIAELPIDVVVEATGAFDYGTETILAMLDAGKHVVSFNAECDALLGWLFHQRARTNDVIYTIADGDQPGVLFRLQQQVEAMGFEVTALLNCKRHLDVHQNPETGAGYAARDTTSALMTTAFGDGTKMQVEQAVVANATGLVPDVRGMHGIVSNVATAAVDIGSVLSGPGRVDFTLGGDFGAGVGILGQHPNPDLHEKAMRFYKMGDGPNYFFFRPYHLVHLEVPLTIGELLLDNEPLVTVDGPHVAEVIAIAKKDLAANEDLDCIGGFSAYGHIDTAENAAGYLPIGLVEYASMTAPVVQDAPIPLDAVSLDESKTVVREWRALSGNPA
ncbi:MAG: putative homoserine dehydrogenase-like protein [Verrucomicrobiales bacterium]|jgi:predicted homoserine dehydrogenase-like protein